MTYYYQAFGIILSATKHVSVFILSNFQTLFNQSVTFGIRSITVFAFQISSFQVTCGPFNFLMLPDVCICSLYSLHLSQQI